MDRGRRKIHQRILVSVTLVLIGGCFYSAIRGDMRMFLIVCGGYAGFLTLFTLVCWLRTPGKRCRRPVVPNEFKSLRPGLSRDQVECLREGTAPLKEVERGDIRHVLYQIERKFDNGIWRCEVELAADKIIACSVKFVSEESPVFDTGWIKGRGLFIVPQEPMGG